MTIRGTAAEVPYAALPPSGRGRRLVVVWHLLGEPDTPPGMAAALPLAGLDAWRVYLALPPRGQGPDVLLDGYAPVVLGALESFPRVVEALREQLRLDQGPVDVVGGSAGGHVALLAAARAEVAVRRVAAINPAVTASAVAAVSRQHYDWTPRSRAFADAVDLCALAGRITAPVLLVQGEREYPAFRPEQLALHRALPDSRLVVVPDLEHMLVGPTGAVEAEVAAWLN